MFISQKDKLRAMQKLLVYLLPSSTNLRKQVLGATCLVSVLRFCLAACS